MTRTIRIGIAALLLVACLIVAGCMQASSSATSAGARLNPPPATIGVELQRLADDQVRANDIPGLQIGISTPQWTWNSAAGNASEVTGEPARPDMRFLIASVSKTFTSVAVQKLAEEGRLSLDDTLDRWLSPDLAERIPNARTITVRQLLDHTSGIADYDEQAINMREIQYPDTPVPYQAGLEDGLAASPLYPPGTNYTYSNVNYILLTLIVDAAAGVPYEDYATRTILVPLGLNETFFQQTNRIPGPHMQAAFRDENGTVRDFTDLYVQFDRGAGDLVSTTADLNRFHRALREGKVLGNASLTAMENGTPQSGGKYGLGYETQRIVPPNVTVQGHTGGYPGSYTCWYYLPETDTYVTFNLNNLHGTPPVEEKIVAIRAAVLAFLKNGPSA